MLRPLVLCLGALLAVSAPALAQTGANVLLVANANSADSVRIAEAYARARAVPEDQVLRIKVDAAQKKWTATSTTGDSIADRRVAGAATSAQDRILYIVLAKGVPAAHQGHRAAAPATIGERRFAS